MSNAINWFEIPVANLDRAVAFYERALAKAFRREDFGGMPTAVFPYEGRDGVGGALVVHPHRKPSPDGAIVYIDVADQLDAVLARVGGLGGEVLLPRTDIGDPGFIAVIRDSEGNHVGLHQAR